MLQYSGKCFVRDFVNLSIKLIGTSPPVTSTVLIKLIKTRTRITQFTHTLKGWNDATNNSLRPSPGWECLLWSQPDSGQKNQWCCGFMVQFLDQIFLILRDTRVVVTVHGRYCNAYKHYQMLKTAEPHLIIKISIHYFIMTDSFHAHLTSKWKVITYTNPCTVIVIHGHKSSVKK